MKYSILNPVNFICLAFLFPLVGIARWAGVNDSPLILKSMQMKIRIDKNGSWTAERSSRLLVNNEQGRLSLSSGLIKYNSRASKISGVKAQTLNASEKIEVESDYIEDKAIASSAEGFDETRQVSIAYPKVEVGSEVTLSYRMETIEVPIPGFFSSEFVFGDDFLEEASDIEITAPFPLYVEKRDPQNSIELKQSDEKGNYRITIHLVKPVSSRVVDEVDPKVGRSRSTWVVVSSEKEWPRIALPLLKDYETVLEAKLPELYAAIAKEATKAVSVEDRINTVTSKLAESIRYLGDWRAVRGGHVPRPLSTVATTRFGDCKDYSAATVSILRSLGYEAHIAWVERGNTPDELPKLPTETAFNHAIVWMRDGKRIRWIDPTNTVSFAKGPFEDIMGRDALVIDSKSPRLEKISEGGPTDAKIERDIEIQFLKNGDAKIDAKVSYLGRGATSITGIERHISKETINHLLTKLLAEENFIIERKVDPYDLHNRIVKDITLGAHLKLKSFTVRTSAGSAYGIPRGPVGKLIDLETQPRVSDLFLGFPATDRARYRLKGVKLVGKLGQGCRIKTPWLEFQRSYAVTKGGIDVVDDFQVLSAALPVEAMRSADFEKFQEKLQSCIHKIAIVFKL